MQPAALPDTGGFLFSGSNKLTCLHVSGTHVRTPGCPEPCSSIELPYGNVLVRLSLLPALTVHGWAWPTAVGGDQKEEGGETYMMVGPMRM